MVSQFLLFCYNNVSTSLVGNTHLFRLYSSVIIIQVVFCGFLVKWVGFRWVLWLLSSRIILFVDCNSVVEIVIGVRDDVVDGMMIVVILYCFEQRGLLESAIRLPDLCWCGRILIKHCLESIFYHQPTTHPSIFLLIRFVS